MILLKFKNLTYLPPNILLEPILKLNQVFGLELSATEEGAELLQNDTPGVYKPPFSPPSRGGGKISALSEQGRKLAVFH